MDNDTLTFVVGICIGTVLTLWMGGLILFATYHGTAVVTPAADGYVWKYQSTEYVISDYDTNSCARIQELLKKME